MFWICRGMRVDQLFRANARQPRANAFHQKTHCSTVSFHKSQEPLYPSAMHAMQHLNLANPVSATNKPNKNLAF